MSDQTLTKSNTFLCKKWFLFVFEVLLIIGDLVMTVILNISLRSSTDISDKSKILIMTNIIGTLIFLTQIIGFVGTLKENKCLIFLYSLLLDLFGLALIYVAILTTFFSIFVVIFGLVSMLSYSYAKDIHKIEQAPIRSNLSTVNSITTFPNPVYNQVQFSNRPPSYNEMYLRDNLGALYILSGTSIQPVTDSNIAPSTPPPPYSIEERLKNERFTEVALD